MSSISSSASLQVNDFYGDHFLGPIVNAFEHLAEGALPDFSQFGKKLFGICFLGSVGEKEKGDFPVTHRVLTTARPAVFPGQIRFPHLRIRLVVITGSSPLRTQAFLNLTCVCTQQK